MPAGDGTGPIGMGPRTGRGAGYCSGYDAPGWANPMPGRGLGHGAGFGGGAAFGRGGGRGWSGYGGRGGGGRGRRNWYYATGVPGWARFGYAPAYGMPPAWENAPYADPAPEQEVEFLKRQAEMLKQELDAIARRVKELTEQA